MIIQFYKNNAEVNKLDKTGFIELQRTLNGTLKDGTSIINPIVKIYSTEGLQVVDDFNVDVVDSNNSDIYFFDDGFDIVNTNYAYIPEFRRYYFISDIVVLYNNIYQISMQCDVLMSFKEEIKNLSGLISRNEFIYNEFIEDSLVNYEFNKEISYFTPANLSTVTSLTTTPSTDNAVISYLTDDNITFSGGLSALNDLPAVSSYLTGGNMTTQYLVGSAGIIYDLAHSIYKDDTLLSYIKSIMIYPYSIDNAVIPDVTDIKIGSTTYPLTAPFKVPNHYPDRIIISDFELSGATSFMDYEPYTKYEIYVPYCGYINLSADAILGKHLKVFYVVNYEEGTSSAFIYSVNDSKVIYTQSCVLGNKISLSSTNSRELSDQKNALALNTGINIISSALTVGGGLASGNLLTSAGGVLSAGRTIGSAITTYNQMYDVGNVNISSIADGFSNLQKVHIKTTRGVSINYNSDFRKLHGKPLNEYKQIKTLTGYTEISDIHIENINATSQELNNIESLLKDGFII